MRKLFLGALAFAAFVPAAHASLVSVTFTSYGNGVTPPATPAGTTLVSNFADSTGLTGTGNYLLVTGSSTGNYLAPAYSASTADPNQYLAVEANATATLTLPKETGVQIYVGSLDSYNVITFSNGLSYSGAQLASMISGLGDNGCEFCANTNGRLWFTFSPFEAVTWVEFSSSSNAFEVAQVSSSNAIPEASTSAMLLAGLAGLGFAGYRRTTKIPSGLE